MLSPGDRRLYCTPACSGDTWKPYYREYGKQRYWANREKALAYAAEQRQRDPERMVRYYAANMEKQKEAIAKWHRENPDRVKAISQKRRAAKFSVPFEDISPQEIFERDQWIMSAMRGGRRPLPSRQ